jgi:hypothetical protein
LSAIAAGWTIREADKRSIEKLLAMLIRVLSHVRALRAESETFKEHVESLEEYERLRKRWREQSSRSPAIIRSFAISRSSISCGKAIGGFRLTTIS